jgi:hypothetical protein
LMAAAQRVHPGKPPPRPGCRGGRVSNKGHAWTRILPPGAGPNAAQHGGSADRDAGTPTVVRSRCRHKTAQRICPYPACAHSGE